uniref:Cell wall hydrolase n=1 Tax=Dulem virus 29 TaxID=3145747 RepID=A0AAU8AUW0_9CAUD
MVNEDIEVLTKTIYGEADGETLLGKKAVASVIMNRYKRRTWFSGKTIAETCKFCVKGSKYHQFSCWNPFDKAYKRIMRASDEDLKECRDIAEKYINGTYKDVVCGCCHYHHVGINPKWARGIKPDFYIGHHLFYSKVK